MLMSAHIACELVVNVVIEVPVIKHTKMNVADNDHVWNTKQHHNTSEYHPQVNTMIDALDITPPASQGFILPKTLTA